MAERNVTLHASACKENSNTTSQELHSSLFRERQLTILKAVRESKSKSHLEYRPVQLEPYALLRGQWLEKAGFTIGQKITVQVGHRQIIITPSDAPPTKL